jgi:hypothetical protein
MYPVISATWSLRGLKLLVVMLLHPCVICSFSLLSLNIKAGVSFHSVPLPTPKSSPISHSNLYDSLMTKFMTTAVGIFLIFASSIASAIPVVRRNVYAPRIITPTEGDVWAIGEHRTVTWYVPTFVYSVRPFIESPVGTSWSLLPK